MQVSGLLPYGERKRPFPTAWKTCTSTLEPFSGGPSRQVRSTEADLLAQNPNVLVQMDRLEGRKRKEKRDGKKKKRGPNEGSDDVYDIQYHGQVQTAISLLSYPQDNYFETL